MRRPLVICLIAAAAAGGTSTVAAAEAPRASLQAPICQQSSDPLDRAIAITAVMRPLTGTARMELQFNLLEKPRGSSSYSVVTGGDLGRWITPSDPALGQRADDVWILRKLVVNLAAPEVYRFHVRFRWTAAHGRLLGRQSRWGEPCDQA